MASSHPAAAMAAESLRRSIRAASVNSRGNNDRGGGRVEENGNNSDNIDVEAAQQHQQRQPHAEPRRSDDTDDDDDDDDDSQRTRNFDDNDIGGGIGQIESDLFNVDPYKILHYPGHIECQGRNIVNILDDRMTRGPRFRNASFHVGKTIRTHSGDDDGEDDKQAGCVVVQRRGQGDEGIHADGISTPINNEVACSPTLMSLEGASNDDDVQFQSPPTNQQQSIVVSSYFSPPNPPQRQNNSNYSQQQQQQQYPHAPSNSALETSLERSTPLLRHPPDCVHDDDHDATAADNQSLIINNIISNRTSKSTPLLSPRDVTSEITSFSEYAASTKFRANYLKHLTGGKVPPMIRPGALGTYLRLRGNAGDGRRNADGRWGGNWDDEGLTDELRETNHQSQQHLGQHNLRQRMLHPLQHPVVEGEGGGGAPGNRANNASNTGAAGIGNTGSGADASNAGNALSSDGEAGQRGDNIHLRHIQQQLRERRRAQQQLVAARAHDDPRLRQPREAGWRRASNNSNNPNPAVSTISIAFSPDSRTLASTHGDHTVKITCCHTGKLLRSLEGHPRTPWTVKYHPANPRIVASGCLGFQVRVWDWNFQREEVRKRRRAKKERTWGGRYDLDRRSRGSSEGHGGLGRGKSRGMMAGADTVDYFGKSPRGVVEHPWKPARLGDTDNEDDADCVAVGASLWGLPAQHHLLEEDDDYAAYVLAEVGIPPDDPAWYDTESEAYDYEDGIGVCLNMIRLHSAVISLSFHPSGEILAMASGSTLHLWDYNEEKRRRKRKLGSGDINVMLLQPLSARDSDTRVLSRSQNSDFPRSQTMDFRHDSALRCVHFPPCGNLIIVGGVNPPSANDGLPNYHRNDPRRRGGMSGGGMSFHLRLWDFDLDAVLDPLGGDGSPSVSNGERPRQPTGSTRGGSINDEGELIWNYPSAKQTLSNPRTIVPRVLLYNDGGFDLSKDGKVLSACADFWLPDGIESAMDLLQSQRQMEEEEAQQWQSLSSLAATDGATIGLMSPPMGDGTYQNGVSSPPPRNPPPLGFPDPRTPPPNFSMISNLEPPSPPGKRNVPGIHGAPRRSLHTPHPLSVVAAAHAAHKGGGGRYVPHIVMVSLDTSPPPDGEPIPLNPKIVRTEGMRRHPNLGRLLVAAPLDGAKSSGVTCVKLSPSAEYVLLGYGVRESIPSSAADGTMGARHPVTSIYNVERGMRHVCTLTCGDDDVNIARFHPESGHGFVYGTKQGRVRVMAKRPWSCYYDV